MSIVFAGTPENAAVTLRELHLAGVPISLVITREDAAVGRKAILTPSPVAAVAEELSLPILKTNRFNEQQIEQISMSGAEFAIVVAFGLILTGAALDALPKGWFNLHYSLLPKWRGAAPVQHSIISGDTETGVTLFRIDEGLDTGPIVGSVQTEIQPRETAGELLSRLTHIGVSVLLQEIPKIFAGIHKPERQPEIGISVAPKLSRNDAFISFQCSANDTYARIRGVTPEPGAWTNFKGQPLKLLSCSASSYSLDAGHVALVDGAVLVGCLSGSIELITVQPAGKNKMSAVDWHRGQRDVEIVLGDV